jgi:hypothetical protein
VVLDRAAVGKRAGQLGKSAPHGNRLEADFDENVSVWRPIDKGVTPSYLSTNPADPAASRRRCMKDVRKVRHFPRSTTMSDRAGVVATKIGFCRGVSPHRIW